MGRGSKNLSPSLLLCRLWWLSQHLMCFVYSTHICTLLHLCHKFGRHSVWHFTSFKLFLLALQTLQQLVSKWEVAVLQ